MQFLSLSWFLSPQISQNRAKNAFMKIARKTIAGYVFKQGLCSLVMCDRTLSVAQPNNKGTQ